MDETESYAFPGQDRHAINSREQSPTVFVKGEPRARLSAVCFDEGRVVGDVAH
jgi:hypothetical protein